MANIRAKAGSSKQSPAAKKSDSKSKMANRDYSSIIEAADKTDNPYGYKYQAAVSMAKDELGEDATDDELTDYIDQAFSQMDVGDVTGEQMRGQDNLVHKAGSTVNDAIDNVTGFLGNGLDAAWGGLSDLVGLVDKDSGEAMDEWFTPEMGQAIADTAIDLGLAAIPVAGVPLVVGKNLVQNGDDLAEAITGHDSVTGEELNGWQQLGKGAGAVADTVLAALPAVGKTAAYARGMKGARDIMASSADDAVRAAASKMGTPAAAAGRAVERVTSLPSRATDAVKSGAETAGKALSSASRPKDVLQALKSGRGAAKAAMRSSAPSQATNATKMGQRLIDMNRAMAGKGQGVSNALDKVLGTGHVRSIAENAGRNLGTIASSVGAQSVGSMAEQGYNPVDAMTDTLQKYPGQAGRLMASAYMPGLGTMAKRMPSAIGGSATRGNMAAARTAANMGMGNRTQPANAEGMGDEDIVARLRRLAGGE